MSTTTTAPDFAALGWTVESYSQTFSLQAPPEIAGTTATRWQAVKDGRAILSGWETREGLEEALRERIEEDTPTTVVFASGAVRTLAKVLADNVIGLDESGNVVVEDEGITYPLTPCHFASAKGSQGLTVCRVCYEEVSDYFGGIAHATDFVVR